MTNNEIILKNIMSKIFNINPEDINNESSMDTIETWDSVKHLNLVLAIEDTFKVSLSEDQAVEIISYPLIKLVLTEHHINF